LGNITIRARTNADETKKGIMFFTIISNFPPEIPEAPKRITPTGGVKMPSIKVTTIRIPSQRRQNGSEHDNVGGRINNFEW
jgi:hypothetical protein